MVKLGALYSFGIAAGLAVEGDPNLMRSLQKKKSQVSVGPQGDVGIHTWENKKRPTTYRANENRMVVGSTGMVVDETESLLEGDDASRSEIQFNTGYAEKAPMSPPTDFLEIHDAVPTTNLLALDTPVMRGVLTTLSKEVYTSGRTTAIKHLTDAMVLLERQTPTPRNKTDGGTAALEDRHKAMVDVVRPAITTMQAGLVTDFATAQTDLETLFGVINTTLRTVLPLEKASIKTDAHNWCIAWTTRDAAVEQCNNSTHDVNNFDPTIATNDAFYKYIGAITDCSAGTTLVNSQCPIVNFNLDQRLRDGFQKARNDYHSLDTIKQTKCAAKTDAVDDEGKNKTAYGTRIDTILDDHVAACGFTVYTSAVSSFNTNNGHRVSMYQALDKILCHLEKETTAITSCLGALPTRAAMFPNYNTASAVCPTRAEYAAQISQYEGLSLTESWVPSDTTCPLQ